VYLLGIRVLLAGLLPSAVALSWVLGTVVYAAFGLGGYVLVCLYFILGSAVRMFDLAECVLLSTTYDQPMAVRYYGERLQGQCVRVAAHRSRRLS
jgi:uncharacterized membrane protein